MESPQNLVTLTIDGLVLSYLTSCLPFLLPGARVQQLLLAAQRSQPTEDGTARFRLAWVPSPSQGVVMLTMRRLQAPARHKPGVEQHQRRALWLPPREATSNIQNRAAGKPICGRFGAYQTFDWDRHRRPNMIARVTSSRFDYRV